MVVGDMQDEHNLDGLAVRKTTTRMAAICRTDEQTAGSKMSNTTAEVVACSILMKHA